MWLEQGRSHLVGEGDVLQKVAHKSCVFRVSVCKPVSDLDGGGAEEVDGLVGSFVGVVVACLVLVSDLPLSDHICSRMPLHLGDLDRGRSPVSGMVIVEFPKVTIRLQCP